MNDENGSARAPERPLIRTFVRDGQVHVVADLPGTTREDVGLRVQGDVLALQTDVAGEPVVEYVDLPAGVDPESADATFNNGVLHVTFDTEGRRAVRRE
jgi:HSP20 family protein